MFIISQYARRAFLVTAFATFLTATTTALGSSPASEEALPNHDCYSAPELPSRQNTCLASPQEMATHFQTLGKLAACPPGEGFRPLSSLHPANAIVIRPSNLSEMTTLQNLQTLLTKENQPIHFMVIGGDWLKKEIQNSPYKPLLTQANIHWINGGNATPWMQDIMEMGAFGKSGQPAIYQLPGIDEHADSETPEKIAKACNLPYLQGIELKGNEDTLGQFSSEGGNIELFPGGVLVTGNNLNAQLRRELEKNLGRWTTPVDTRWLATGHADEMFTIVRTDKKSPCNFAILHASPKLGLKLSKDSSLPLEPARPPKGNKIQQRAPEETNYFHNCLDRIPRTEFGEPAPTGLDVHSCAALVRANEKYESIIQANLTKITRAVSFRTGCFNVSTIALPQLFIPQAGYDGKATALNPNLANGMTINNLYIAPSQPNAAFQTHMEKVFQERGAQIRFIPADAYHFAGGGLHCATNVLRSCSNDGKK